MLKNTIYYIAFLFAVPILAQNADCLAVQAAINANDTLQKGRTYVIDNCVHINANKSLHIPAGTTIELNDINNNDTAAVIMHGDAVLTGAGTIISGRLNWNAANKQTGILVFGNMNIIDFGVIANFETGIQLYAKESTGTCYNNIKVKQIYNAIFGVKLDTHPHDAWVNQNYISADIIACSSTRIASDPINYAKTYGIYTDSHSGYAPNTNRFTGSILSMNTGIRLCGSYNRIEGMRLACAKKIELVNYTGIYQRGSNDFTMHNYWIGEFGYTNFKNEVTVNTNYPINVTDSFSYKLGTVLKYISKADYELCMYNSYNGTSLVFNKRLALQGIGVRGPGIWATELRIEGNSYFKAESYTSTKDSIVFSKSGKYKQAISNPVEKLKHLIAEEKNTTTNKKLFQFNAAKNKKYIPLTVQTDENNDYIDYQAILPILIEAIKTQKKELTASTIKLEKQKKQYLEYKKQADELKKAMALIPKPNYSAANNYFTLKNNPIGKHEKVSLKLNYPEPIIALQITVCSLGDKIVQNTTWQNNSGFIEFDLDKKLNSGMYKIKVLLNNSTEASNFLIIQ